MDNSLNLKIMLEKDAFSHWLGIIIDERYAGYCRLRFEVKEQMLNGFSIIHGGVLFSVADSALAFAANTKAEINVALEANISFLRPAKLGELLTVTAKQINEGRKIAVFDIEITNEKAEKVALFRGTTYNTGKPLVLQNGG